MLEKLIEDAQKSFELAKEKDTRGDWGKSREATLKLLQAIDMLKKSWEGALTIANQKQLIAKP